MMVDTGVIGLVALWLMFEGHWFKTLLLLVAIF